VGGVASVEVVRTGMRCFEEVGVFFDGASLKKADGVWKGMEGSMRSE
jgi:hypothetical protein